MIEFLVIVIIIAYIVSRTKKQGGQNGSQRTKTETIYMNGKPIRVKREQKSYSQKQTYNRPEQPYAQQTNQSYGAPAGGAYQKTKAQSGGRRAGANAGENTGANAGAKDILERARQNVAETEADILEKDDAQHHQAAHGAADFAGTYPYHESESLSVSQAAHRQGTEEDDDILRKVNDLIVMGYQPNLEFGRDFVAEGVEMINRYQTLVR